MNVLIKYKKRIVALAVILAILAITSYRNRDRAPDAWVRNPSAGIFDQENEFTAVEFNKVLESKRPIVEEELKSVDIVPISVERAAFLTSGPAHKGNPFLVRALSTDSQTGAFIVKSWKDSLIVHYGYLSHSTWPVFHAPLVVWLSEQPKQVFIGVSSAE